MSSRIERSPTTITHKVQTGGEITINLVLTIKLDGDKLSIAAEPAESRRVMKEIVQKKQEKEDDVDWIIPDIDIGNVITFGKKVEEEKRKDWE